jgi:hypothetical protein
MRQQQHDYHNYSRTIILILCVAIQHHAVRCADASSQSMAAAAQQQQGTLAGVELGTQHTTKVIAR